MAERITWRQIAAPDLSDAIRARESASTMFDKAAGSISGALTGLYDRNTNQENNMAIAEAMKVQEVGAWDKLMGGQGIAALGIDPAKANNNLLNFVSGVRNDLTGRVETDQRINENQYDFGRRQLMDQRADEQYAAELAAKEQQAEIQKRIFGLVPSTLNKQELVGLVENQAREMGAGPDVTKMMLDAARGMDDAHWQVSDTIKGTAIFEPEFALVNDGLAARENRLNMSYGANEAARFYGTAMQRFEGYRDPSKKLIDELRGWVDPTKSDEEKAIFEKSSGEIQKTFNNLKGEYKNLPPELVAMALENNLQDSGWVLTGDQVTFDTKSARQLLDQLSTPESLGALELDRARIEKEVREISRDRQRFTRATEKWELATDNGDEEGRKRAMTELAALSKEVVPAASGSEPSSSPGGNSAPSNKNSAVSAPPMSAGPGAIDGALYAAAANKRASMGAVDGALAAAASAGGNPIQAPTDARITSFNNALGGVGDTLLSFGRALGDNIGRGAGYVAGGLERAGTLPVYAGGLVQGAINPEAGSRTLERADAAWNRAGQFMEVAPAPVSDFPPASPAIQKEVETNPTGALEAIGAEAGVDTGPNSPIGLMLQSLQTGKDYETGEEITPEEKMVYAMEIKKTLSQIASVLKNEETVGVVGHFMKVVEKWEKMADR